MPPASRRRALGQHFLRDPRTARRILDAFVPARSDRVLEIGPGPGALTVLLVGEVGRVVAIEKDATLAAELPARCAHPGNLEVIAGDVLALDLPALLPLPPWRVLSNLPYSVATPILALLLRHRVLFTDLLLMVQHEVAERMLGGPGRDKRGPLHVLCALHADCRRLFSLGPGAFSPPPKVDSTVVHLRIRPAPPPEAREVEAWARIGFRSRRQTLARNLAAGARMDRAAADRLVRDAGIAPAARAEELDLADWGRLAATLRSSGIRPPRILP